MPQATCRMPHATCRTPHAASNAPVLASSKGPLCPCSHRWQLRSAAERGAGGPGRRDRRSDAPGRPVDPVVPRAHYPHSRPLPFLPTRWYRAVGELRLLAPAWLVHPGEARYFARAPSSRRAADARA
eukprot:6869481-Prymnesium_polylepis.1